MTVAMLAKGNSTSSDNQASHATLKAAILRDICAKGKESRFAKNDRGRFGLNVWVAGGVEEPSVVFIQKMTTLTESATGLDLATDGLN